MIRKKGTGRAWGGGTGKYGNHRVMTSGGRKMASKLELRRWHVLQDAERRGLITELRAQVPFELFPTWRKPSAGKDGRVRDTVYRRVCRYIADFTYRRGGTLVVEDTKGFITPEFRLKEEIMHFVLGIDISIVRTPAEGF